jgi:hypothetical protein
MLGFALGGRSWTCHWKPRRQTRCIAERRVGTVWLDLIVGVSCDNELCFKLSGSHQVTAVVVIDL